RRREHENRTARCDCARNEERDRPKRSFATLQSDVLEGGIERSALLVTHRIEELQSLHSELESVLTRVRCALFDLVCGAKGRAENRTHGLCLLVGSGGLHD